MMQAWRTSKFIISLTFPLVMICGGLEACSSTENATAEGPCGRELARLKECKLLGEDANGSCDDSLLLRCTHDCFARASCEDLKVAFCTRAGEAPAGSPLAACVSTCISSPNFYCSDGSTVTDAMVCNGTPDCDDGSDESPLLCTNLVCASGETWPKIYECDGSLTCSDGSDEQNCPQFVCSNGESILELQHCDGFPDCSDAGDETGCPPTMWSQLSPHCG